MNKIIFCAMGLCFCFTGNAATKDNAVTNYIDWDFNYTDEYRNCTARLARLINQEQANNGTNNQQTVNNQQNGYNTNNQQEADRNNHQ